MECAVDVSSARGLALPCLDLSRRGISELPEIEGCEHLRCLYLEGNCLSRISPPLFSSCPHLQWLDLRNNHLTCLPPSIQLLRDLKTLLLQGNKLTALPPELGELQQLSGLGLADNPLSFPPPDVVRRGASAVLSFLRDRLESGRTTEEGGEMEGRVEGEGGGHSVIEDSGSDSGRRSFWVKHQLDGTPIHAGEESTMLPHPFVKQTQLALNDGLHHHQWREVRPRVLPRQAHIHPHPPHSSSPHHSQAGRRGRGGKGKEGRHNQRRSGGERRRGDKQQFGERVVVHVPPLTSEEKLQANIEIEKQRSKESLEQWRAEARLDHLKPPAVESGSQTSSDTAPYATEREHSPTLHPAESGKDLVQDYPPSGVGQEEVARKRVEHYNMSLRTQRRQAGLISDASPDLLEAEKRLAEALAQRDEMEERKKRAYRLTAFTADPNLL